MPSVWEKSTKTLSPLICKLKGCQGPCIYWKRISRCEAKWKENKVYWSRICARGRGESTASRVGQLPDNQGEPTLNVGHWSAFIIRGQRNGVRGLVSHLLIGWVTYTFPIWSTYTFPIWSRRRVGQIRFLIWGWRGTNYATEECSKIPRWL